MNPERVRIHVEEALDLLQLITEDIEENFVGGKVDNSVKGRAAITVSVLNILYDHLRGLAKEAQS